MKRKRRARTRLLIAILVLLTITPFALSAQSSAVPDPSSDPVILHARSMSKAFARVAESVTPSLVSIRSNREVDPYQSYNNPLFGQDPGMHGVVPQGMGTGFIYDIDGHIVTNNHVIKGADEIRVRLHDGRETSATVIGQDPATDVAVIKIDLTALVPVRLGDSETLRIGEWVVAAGSPFGFENSITAGIVSAKGRRLISSSSYQDFIQTDAAINPGNSGGPLLDLKGQVIGMNTAIFSPTGLFMGIGFAIPVKMVKQVADSLIKEGRVVRGWLGVVIQPLTPELSASFGYKGTDGILVSDIATGGPSDKAGLQIEDIIVEFNGEAMASDNHLRNTVAATRPGTVVPVNVFRDGEMKTIEVTLGEHDGDPVAVKPQPTHDKEVVSLGLRVQTFTEEMKLRRDYKGEGSVIVSSVGRGSAAERSGIIQDDVVLRVGDTDISSPEQLKKLLSEADLETGIRLVLEHGGMKRFAYLKK